ncbi:hypothetical protein C9374_005048 [Naegleria lovaniensis]|uniref:Mitochondrial carrier protein n=1 Tax=Naegleria lovaniensis TaxID=51637 RepID=A0AA88GQS2_NAELO|nr:uncharacterized protein C9374_005048 [Naegleria lovaniensis]KAG2382468.1 hypothetical protein C9374_005048 [Naegleria lovaniensis]
MDSQQPETTTSSSQNTSSPLLHVSTTNNTDHHLIASSWSTAQLFHSKIPFRDNHQNSTSKIHEFISSSRLTQQIIAATFGSCLTAIFTCPLDVIKSRIQTQHFVRSIPHHYIKPCQHHSNHAHHQNFLPLSTRRAFMTIIKNEGAKTLWRGLRPTLLLIIPNNGIYYSLYERLKIEFSGLGHTITPLVSGCIARVMATTVTSPIEFFKTANQVSRNKVYLRDLRWRHLLRGLNATLLRDVPFSSLYWMCYENMKSSLLNRFSLQQHHPHYSRNLMLISFASGMTGGVIATTLTHPFDVIKTNAQNIEAKHVGVWNISQNIYKTNGLSGFSRGLLPRCLKVAPSCAIMISTYELVKSFFETWD